MPSLEIPFTDDIGDCTPAKVNRFARFVKDLPFFENDIFDYDPTKFGTDMEPSLDRVYTSKTDKVAINQELLEQIDLSLPINGGEAKFTERKRTSGKHSRHGVFFGRIALGDSYFDVAVKPFEDIGPRPDIQAFEELSITHAVRNNGLRTFEPVMLGRYVGTTYLLTALAGDVTTFDSVNWTEFRKDPEKNPGMIELLRGLAEQVAEVHSLGWGHGDLSPRNAAVDVLGNVFLIDWEFARLGGEQDDLSVRYERAHPDLLSLVRSFYYPRKHSLHPGIELLPNDDIKTGQELLNEFFLRHYFTRRAEHDGPGAEDINQLKKEIVKMPLELGLEY